MAKQQAKPSYRKHSARDVAFVQVGGKRHYLGRYGSPESHEEYRRHVERWEAARRKERERRRAEDHAAGVGKPVDLTVAEVALAYLEFCKTHYRDADGQPTTEFDLNRRAAAAWTDRYADLPAAELKPSHLKAARDGWVAAGHSRPTVNRNAGRLVRMCKWAVSEELLPAAVYQTLRTLPGLKRGRCAAPDRPPVEPVPADVVDATLPYLPAPVAGLVRLMLASGMRPGEACRITADQVDRTPGLPGNVWLYRPRRHKTAWRNKERAVPLGPAAQAVLLPLMERKKAAEPLFSPRDVRHNRGYNDSYGTAAFDQAVRNAVVRANLDRKEAGLPPLPHWSPNRLRHARLTAVRAGYGLEAAQALGGHATADVTQIYAERDLALAARVAAETG